MTFPIEDAEIIRMYAAAQIAAPMTKIGTEFPELQQFMARHLFVEEVTRRIERLIEERKAAIGQD